MRGAAVHRGAARGGVADGVAAGNGGHHAGNEALAKLKDRLRKVGDSGVAVHGGLLSKEQLPQVVIPRNPSPFGVFAAVRLTCLSNKQRRATLLQLETAAAWKEAEELLANGLGLPGEGLLFQDCTSSSDEALSTKGVHSNNTASSLPKIVGIGLQGVFEIIRESRQAYPNVCRRALVSLLNILQGQQT